MSLGRANLIKHLKDIGSHKATEGFTFEYLEVANAIT